MNDHEAWIARNARRRRALADPAVGAGVALLEPVASSEQAAGAARRELAGLQARWPLLEEDEHEP